MAQKRKTRAKHSGLCHAVPRCDQTTRDIRHGVLNRSTLVWRVEGGARVTSELPGKAELREICVSPSSEKSGPRRHRLVTDASNPVEDERCLVAEEISCVDGPGVAGAPLALC